jgi:flagellar biosynthesis/type III secretory pathway chaperone
MSTRPGISQARISKLLKQELDASKQLKQLLAAEQKAITDHDIPVFEEIINKKRLILERLAQFEQARTFLLESNGIKHGPEGMEACIKRCNDDGTLSDLWQRLLSIAADCRDHNRQNHQLVELFSAHTRKALCILRGETMDRNVYGPDGDTSDPHENRPIAIA